jgi:hypothetical protein
MAQCARGGNEWKLPVQDAGGNPMGFRVIGEGTASAFTVLVLNVGTTSYYYWPNTSGVLRYGTTEPTVATQDSAGAAV